MKTPKAIRNLSLVAALGAGVSVSNDVLEERGLSGPEVHTAGAALAAISLAVGYGVQSVLTRSRTEIEPHNKRLKALVVDPINKNYPNGIRVKGEVRTGEEIARAIPDAEAFLAQVDLQHEDGIFLDFFEINEEGQLVMKDDCAEAYGLGENALEARIRQTCVVYTDTEGQTQVITGKQYFVVTKQDHNGRPLEMKVSDEALAIEEASILMVRGLPTLQETYLNYAGEYARMNIGQLEKETITWTDDKNLSKSEHPNQPNFARARNAGWVHNKRNMGSLVERSCDREDDFLGSRGVLRVNLKFGA